MQFKPFPTVVLSCKLDYVKTVCTIDQTPKEKVTRDKKGILRQHNNS